MSATVDSHPPVDPSPTMSPFARIGALYTRPSQAWAGLETRGQWWFPMLVTLFVMVLTTATTYDRAFLPMMTEQFEQQVASGQVQPDQAERMEEFFSSGAGRWITVGQQVIAIPIFMLISALFVWVAGGFMLGTKLTYRQALDVAAWAGLIGLPGYVLTSAIAWFRNASMQDVHLGLAVLLPESETSSGLMRGLTVFLDWLGPFAIWSLVVAIIGTATLSGAPRKSVAWILSGLFLVGGVFMAALAARFSPGG